MHDTPDFAFRHTGLDRAEPMRTHPAELDAAWQDAQLLVLNEKGEACCYSASEIYYPATRVSLRRPESATLLGFDEAQAYFALPQDAVAHAPYEVTGIRAAAVQWPARDAAIFAQAKAILHWHTQSKFCGRCGGLLDLKTAGYSAVCGGCGLASYPQTHPATIMCVSDGEHLLLGRQAAWPEKRWSLLAGFVEPGETPEQTVVREVREESGVRVERVRYVASQPWPMPMALMVGFDAYAPMQAIQISDELQAARWFSRDQLKAMVAADELTLPDPLSISRYLIMRWLHADSGTAEFWHTKV
ncbi:MAG: NAD(+) diphosphatase [Arenimonas sp.]|uniref:NAD(+) diphosphatase n=1 Tax=Arenimonas sp. TaxID=1872635 RepID=UPI003C0C3B2C